ncbi:MAG: hypothetical protein QX189_10690 [Methylococcales bacterium]
MIAMAGTILTFIGACIFILFAFCLIAGVVIFVYECLKQLFGWKTVEEQMADDAVAKAIAKDKAEIAERAAWAYRVVKKAREAKLAKRD